MSLPEESSLVVIVPEAERFVGTLRSGFDRSAARGAPAHITLLYPFLHPDEIPDTALDELESFFAATPSFSFALTGICGFPGVLYLVPDPIERFDAITRRLVSLHPDSKPYGGAFALPVPHLTVAHPLDDADLEAIADSLFARIADHLPVPCRAERATLLTKHAGQWSPSRDFAFGQTSGVVTPTGR